MLKRPLISVIIPTYNDGPYLKTLLRSIKAQSYRCYEIIIGDYNSSDETLVIAREYGAKIIHVKRRGISAGRNAALRRARGEIIAFIDADYVLSEKVFYEAIKTFEKRGDIVALELSLRLYERDIPERRRGLFKIITRIENVIKRVSFLTPWPWAFSCVFCRKSAVSKIGFFSNKLGYSEDLKYYQKLRRLGRFVLLKTTVERSYRRPAEFGLFRTSFGYFYNSLLASITGRSPHEEKVENKKRV